MSPLSTNSFLTHSLLGFHSLAPWCPNRLGTPISPISPHRHQGGHPELGALLCGLGGGDDGEPLHFAGRRLPKAAGGMEMDGPNHEDVRIEF